MSFAFVCQHNSFIVFKSLQHRSMKNWQLVAKCSVGVSFGLCLLLGIAGYLAFLETTQGDILNNFPATGVAVNAARALLAFTMLFTYPLECYVTRHCLLSIIDRWMMRRELTWEGAAAGAVVGAEAGAAGGGGGVGATPLCVGRGSVFAEGPGPATAGPPSVPGGYMSMSVSVAAGLHSCFMGGRGGVRRGGVHRIQDEDALEMTNLSPTRSPIIPTDTPLRTSDGVGNDEGTSVTTTKGEQHRTSQLPVKPDWLQSNIPVKSDRAQPHIPVKPDWPQSNSVLRSDSADSADGERDWTDPPSSFLGDDEEDGVDGAINTHGVTARNRNGAINKNGVINGNGAINGNGDRSGDSKWTWGVGQRIFSKQWNIIKDDDPPVDNYTPQSDLPSQHQPSSSLRMSSSSQQLPPTSSTSSQPPSSSSSLSSSQSFTRRTALTLLIWGTTVGLALAFDDLGGLTPLRHINPPCLQSIYPQSTLSYYPTLNPPHPLTPPSYPTLSPHPFVLSQVWCCPLQEQWQPRC